MIILRNQLTKEKYPFKITQFPDGTSQVWQIDPLPKKSDVVEVVWMFENEAEVFHLYQLNCLLQNFDYRQIVLIAPYLPYGRQDKRISNQSTFARSSFFKIIHQRYIGVETFDAHSLKNDDGYAYWEPIKSISPDLFFNSILNHDVICFPDEGAYTRYTFNREIPQIYAKKVRDQQTGQIQSLELQLTRTDLTNKDILIVDDICDGGGTFIQLAKELQKYNPRSIDLAVSHGLFSKGKQVLHDAGIRNIYTTNSLLRNPEGFKVIDY